MKTYSPEELRVLLRDLTPKPVKRIRNRSTAWKYLACVPYGDLKHPGALKLVVGTILRMRRTSVWDRLGNDDA